MEHLPNDWLALLFLVFTLGVEHGLDADHLGTIDGLTRFNARHNQRLARWCGSPFSLGHGAVVIVIALVVGALAGRWAVPDWMEDLGALSFDNMSQAALFALAGTQFGSVGHALTLGLVFTAGMLLTDGVNGL
jgi:nickel/cobalt transporter (NiCoT) family protein